MGDWTDALTQGPAVAVVLAPGRAPTLHALAELPERWLELDGETFEDAGLGDWIGFYDWLRTDDGEVIGVTLWPDDKHEALHAVARCANVEASPNGEQVSIFFGDARRYELACSGDQDFGGNQLFVNPTRHVLTFNAPAVFPNWRQSSGVVHNAAHFRWQADDVFARIASRYDLLCDVFSLGIHRLWKREVARVIAAEPWQTLLDGATGTGDIILRVLQQERTQGRSVVASDVSTAMLAIAERRLAAHRGRVEFRTLDMERMPSVPDGSVDAYSISLGLKICDRALALQEAWRVLRPGGRLVVLEASSIRWRPLHRAYLRYMSLCMPVLGWLATGGDASAYRYLLQGVQDFPGAEDLRDELQQTGFTDVTFKRLSLGIVAIHVARKPTR